jgi:hypothetical protein
MCKECEIICDGKKIGRIVKKNKELVIERTSEGECCFNEKCSCNCK